MQKNWNELKHVLVHVIVHVIYFQRKKKSVIEKIRTWIHRWRELETLEWDNPDDNETWSFRWTESDQKLAGQVHLQRTRAKDISA